MDETTTQEVNKLIHKRDLLYDNLQIFCWLQFSAVKARPYTKLYQTKTIIHSNKSKTILSELQQT